MESARHSFGHTRLQLPAFTKFADLSNVSVDGGVEIFKLAWPVIIEQRHQSWLLIRVKRLVKESTLIEKLRSQHQQTMMFSLVTRQHVRCCLVISRVGNQARKSQVNAWPCHGGLIKKTADHMSVQDVYFSRTASWCDVER